MATYIFVSQETGNKIELDQYEYELLQQFAKQSRRHIEDVFREACEMYGESKDGVKKYLSAHIH